MTRAQEIYEAVQALKKKNSTLGTQAAIKQVGGQPSQYYKWAKILESEETHRKTPRKRNYTRRTKAKLKTITVPDERIDSGFMVAMVGTPDNIAASLRQLMK